MTYKTPEDYKAYLRRRGSLCPDCGELKHYQATRCRACWTKMSKRWSNSSGYVLLAGYPDHPNSSNQGNIREHTLVMSQMIGRPLEPGESVHHKNGVRNDNRPENLELWSKSQPPGQRVVDKVTWAVELLSLYNPELLVISSIDELKEYLTNV